MSHKCPSWQKFVVQLYGALEIYNSFVMIATKRVIVSNNAARLRPILIIVENSMCQICQFTIVFFDVKDIWEQIHIFIPIGVYLSEFVKPIQGYVIIQRGVTCMCYLVDYIDTVREVFNQCTIDVDTISFLLNVKVIVREIKVVHPVIFARAGL